MSRKSSSNNKFMAIFSW